MSKSMEQLVDKYNKKRESNRYNVFIWMIAILMSIFFIVVGFLDYTLSYKQVRGTEFEPINITNAAGKVVDTVYPVFGFASVPTGNQGIIPSTLNITVHDWIVLAIIIIVGLPSIAIYQKEARRLAAADDNLPYLFREIADSQRIGMHLPRAIAEAAKRNYGPLTPDLKKLAAKVSWGVPFRDAMTAFRDALETPLTKEATILILEAERSGGELEEIFDSATKHIQEQLDIRHEREGAIKPYMAIIYISFLILVLVIWVLFNTFFIQFGKEPILVGDTERVVVPLHAFRVAFLYFIVAQGFFSGLIAGKMAAGSVKSGFYHSTILMIIGYIIYKLAIG